MSKRGRNRARKANLRKLPRESKKEFHKRTGLKVGAKGVNREGDNE